MLEYCSPVWSPSSIVYVNKLESVQRRFTKKLKGLNIMSYDERLDKLDIERLELRRLHFDLITCFKILHNYVDLPAEDFFYSF